MGFIRSKWRNRDGLILGKDRRNKIMLIFYLFFFFFDNSSGIDYLHSTMKCGCTGCVTYASIPSSR